MAEMTTDFVQCLRAEDILERSIIALNIEGHSNKDNRITQRFRIFE